MGDGDFFEIGWGLIARFFTMLVLEKGSREQGRAFLIQLAILQHRESSIILVLI